MGVWATLALKKNICEKRELESLLVPPPFFWPRLITVGARCLEPEQRTGHQVATRWSIHLHLGSHPGGQMGSLTICVTFSNISPIFCCMPPPFKQRTVLALGQPGGRLSCGRASKLGPPTHLWCAPGSGRRHTVLGTTCGKAAAAERKPQTLERAPGAAALPGRRVSVKNAALDKSPTIMFESQTVIDTKAPQTCIQRYIHL